MKKLLEYKFQLLAMALLGAGLMMSRGGMAVLMPLGRVLIPVILVLVVFRMAKKKLTASFSEIMRKQMEAAGLGQMAGGPGARGPAGGRKVLDLCPKCGSMLAPGHRCR